MPRKTPMAPLNDVEKSSSASNAWSTDHRLAALLGTGIASYLALSILAWMWFCACCKRRKSGGKKDDVEPPTSHREQDESPSSDERGGVSSRRKKKSKQKGRASWSSTSRSPNIGPSSPGSRLSYHGTSTDNRRTSREGGRPPDGRPAIEKKKYTRPVAAEIGYQKPESAKRVAVQDEVSEFAPEDDPAYMSLAELSSASKSGRDTSSKGSNSKSPSASGKRADAKGSAGLKLQGKDEDRRSKPITQPKLMIPSEEIRKNPVSLQERPLQTAHEAPVKESTKRSCLVFWDMHRMMRDHMRDMDAMFDPFTVIGGRATTNGGRHHTPRQQMIDDGDMLDRRDRQPVRGERGSVTPYRDPISSLMEPFGFGFGSGLFGGLMRQMEQLQSQALTDPDSHVFTQSTVISMAPGEDGRPKYYEATESVRKAGDIKETRRSVRDSDRELEKMEIGHHIGDRGHVIEKRRDRNTGGQIVSNQQFIGLRDGEAQQFDREWSRATRRALSGDRYLVDDDSAGAPQLAIEGHKRHRSQSVPRHQQSYPSSGPVIEEITDENDSGKRRSGGFLGRMKTLFRA